MTIPTEPVGSVPRPSYLLDAMAGHADGTVDDAAYEAAVDRAVSETVEAMAATGSPVITDGEQSKPSFATYPLSGMQNLAPDGVVIPFEDGHNRQLPRLTAGPFRYTTYSGQFVSQARRHATRPLKQAVIAPSALSLLYPEGGRSPDGELREFKPGAAWIARRAGAPVVPVRLIGTHDVLPKGRAFPRRAKVTVRFGSPLTAADGESAKEFNVRIEKAVRSL